MKTFKQFILEEKVEKLEDLLERRCKPFLDESDANGFLYRGITSFKSAIKELDIDVDGQIFKAYVMPVRKDRRPLNIEPELSKALDDWFEKRHGFRARSEAVFCFGEGGRIEASAYGQHKAIIFPIGEFEYVWSPVVHDLYDLVQPQNYENLKDLGHLDSFMGGEYTTTGLNRAVTRDSEIMIKCDQYLAIPYSSRYHLHLLHKAANIAGGVWSVY